MAIMAYVIWSCLQFRHIKLKQFFKVKTIKIMWQNHGTLDMEYIIFPAQKAKENNIKLFANHSTLAFFPKK